MSAQVRVLTSVSTLRETIANHRLRPTSLLRYTRSRRKWRRPGTCRSAPNRCPTAASTSVSGRRAAARLPSRSKASSRRRCNAEPDGYFSLWSVPAQAGMRYRFRLDRGDALPDPASRFQPEGPHGPSEILDPGAFAWTDDTWRGVAREQLVIYEMHIGTFTPEGSWEAAARELPALAELGITCIEIMPVAEFAGRFGWGYDGVNLFAPTRLYGRPDDFRRFVDRAHALGIAVILDVVYNHFGPDGNYLKLFSAAYFTDRYDNDWGEAINFDGPDSGPVREFFLANAGYWIDEYHLDGLRLDATQADFRSIGRSYHRRHRSAGALGGARQHHLCCR